MRLFSLCIRLKWRAKANQRQGYVSISAAANTIKLYANDSVSFDTFDLQNTDFKLSLSGGNVHTKTMTR